MMEKIGKIAKVVAVLLVFAIILYIALMCFMWFGVLRKYYKAPAELAATHDYSVSSQLISDKDYKILMNNEETADAYTLGVNDKGELVFTAPKAAWKAAKKECKDGIKAEKKAFDLKHRSRTYYMAYIDAAKKLDKTDLEPEEKAQAEKWAIVLDIYKNSFSEKAHR
ncbi:MAG: hypothetical protein MJ129_03840 [Clostridia bacterium]|nr:hypothetical protein [Clostridia bacterium]